jgi:hypothetical protein
MKGSQIAGLAVGAVVFVFLLMNARDLYRYIKISNM